MGQAVDNGQAIEGDGTPDRVTLVSIHGADTYDRHSNHISSQWETVGNSVVLSSVWNSYVIYEIDNPVAGMHQVTVHTSCTNGAPGVVDRTRMIFSVDGHQIETAPADGTGTYTFYTPWLTVGTHLIKCTPSEGSSELRIDRFELGAIDGADSDGNGIQDWMEPRLAQGIDTDGDGIPDYAEIMLHGTDPLDADSDGDGLIDGDELAAGTDLLDGDSDGDGVLDGVEVHELLTDPLVAEFDGTVSVVATVSGSQTNNAVGTWEAEGTSIVAKRRRGFVEYTVNFPAQDCYGLSINAAHLWNKSSCTPITPVDTSALQISVDGVYVGSYSLVSAEGVPADVRAFLPVLPAGEHTIRIFWENVHSRLALQINTLELQSLGGPDANGNGTKDWVETSIASMAGVDTMLQSIVSPACLEGNARYVSFMSMTGGAEASLPAAVKQSAGARWYANLPLEQDGITQATATFQNGALEVPINVEWVPLNIMDHDGETILIRKGDSVKFVALPEDANGGQFEIEYLLDVEGEVVRSPNTRPLVYHFPSAGTYTVSGQYTHGNDVVTATIHVQVVGGTFPEESPACLVGRTREWTFEGMDTNIVFEVDDTVELVEATPSSLDPESGEGTAYTNAAPRTVSLRANDTNGEHVMLARLYENGPILDSTRLDTFWVQNATDGYFWTVERYEDSELWEVESIVKNLPDTVDLEIKVFIAGVTLDDYTLERWITNADYDEIGEYRFRLFHPNSVQTSACHSFKVYQNGQFIGEAFSAGQNNIGEE